METEIFKDIIGYENYQISNLGNIKSLIKYNGTKERILKIGIDNSGYAIISLCKNGNSKTYRIHRLIAQYFINNQENKPQVNHINGVRNDNRIENLEWCTASENHLHKFRVLGYKNNMKINGGPSKGKFGKNNHLSKKVNQYDLQGNFIKTWDSISDIKKELGFIISSISKCCNGKQKTYGGFIWAFEKYFYNEENYLKIY